MFKTLKKAKNNTVTFVKANAPHIIPNALGVAAVVFVYYNYTEKQHTAYVNHLDNMDATYQEAMDTLVQQEIDTPALTE